MLKGWRWWCIACGLLPDDCRRLFIAGRWLSVVFRSLSDGHVQRRTFRNVIKVDIRDINKIFLFFIFMQSWISIVHHHNVIIFHGQQILSINSSSSLIFLLPHDVRWLSAGEQYKCRSYIAPRVEFSGTKAKYLSKSLKKKTMQAFNPFQLRNWESGGGGWLTIKNLFKIPLKFD